MGRNRWVVKEYILRLTFEVGEEDRRRWVGKELEEDLERH